MAETTSAAGSQQPSPNAQADYDKLVQQVADEVWKMWQEALRHEHERSGSHTKGK